MAQKFTVPLSVKQLSSAGSDAITIFVDSDTYARLQVQAGGRLVWGSGSGVGDVNLYREGANSLKTDDTFKAASLFVDGVEVDTTGAATDQVLKFDGVKFAPADESGGANVTIQSTAPSGAESGDLWLDSDDNVLYILDTDGTTWISVTGSLTLAGLNDVNISSLEDGQILKYSSSTSSWYNEYEIPLNLDGGDASSNYGGIVAISGGGASG